MHARSTAALLSLDDPRRKAQWLRLVMLGAIYLFLASNFFSIAVNSISLGFIAIAWIVLMIVERRVAMRSTPLDYFFLAYLLAEVASTVFSQNPAQSLLFSKRILLIGIVYLFATVVTTEALFARFVAILLGTSIIVAVIGVGKLLFGDPVENTRLGIFQFYMTTSELMMTASLLLLPFVLHRGTPRVVRWLAAAGFSLVVICLYATVTRGAYLAAAAGMVVIAIVKDKRFLIVLLLLILCTVLFAPPYVESRIVSIVDLRHPDNVNRLLLWATGFKILADHPIVGVGDIDLHDLLVQYAPPGSTIVWGHLHNTYLHILVTLGLFGACAVVAMFAKIAMTEWEIYRKVRDQWLYGSFALGALAVFVGLLVNGLTEWSFGDQEIVIMLWTTFGLVLGITNLPSAYPGPDA
jgi:O-antigen ligase